MSTEQKHTPEPWRTGGTLGTLIVDASGHEVAAAQGVKDRHKIAARIVACVNACAGMDNPAETIQRLRDFAQTCADAWDGDTRMPLVNQARYALGELETIADDEACTLRHQRDRLLAALGGILADTHAHCRYDALNPCWNNRPTDVPGKHWGGGDACPTCTGRAILAECQR